MDNFFIEKAIKVRQPFGDFFITSIPASILVDVCYSFPASYGEESLSGIQRQTNEKRIGDIAKFCKTKALFPNSIILSANIAANGEVVEENEQWYINNNSEIVIPQRLKIASIIDGQHRIEGIRKALNEGGDDIDLVCSIYFGLPAPRQAEVFATINFNQQKVDKSLAYQLFGYNLDLDKRKYWSPDTLAIYITRLLDQENDSPLKQRVSFGMEKIDALDIKDWKISTAVMVDGISRLFSKDSARDRYKLHERRLIAAGREVLNQIKDDSPLRSLYINYNDTEIYNIILSFFKSINIYIWLKSDTSDIMFKTIAIQALLDILKKICEQQLSSNKDIREIDFNSYMSKVDSTALNRLNANFSGMGRTQIRKELEKQLKI